MPYQQQQNNSSYNNPGKDGYHDQDRLASSDRSRVTMLIDNQEALTTSCETIGIVL